MQNTIYDIFLVKAMSAVDKKWVKLIFIINVKVEKFDIIYIPCSWDHKAASTIFIYQFSNWWNDMTRDTQK